MREAVVTNDVQAELKLGRIALAAAVVMPGITWILKGKGVGQVVMRSVVIASVVAVAVAIEGAVDEAAGAVVDSI